MRRAIRGFTLIELMIVVVILGVLATVAVPAFIKYMRRAKTVEAIDQIDKIFKGAALYYSTPSIASDGSKRPCQFPGTAPVTPVEATCCASGGADTNGDDRCDADPEIWSSPVWAALSFQLTDEHYFTYSFTSSGVLGDAAFIANANADLDCNGVHSTFQRLGFGDLHPTKAECAMHGTSSFYRERATE